MIDHIRGKVSHKEPNLVVIECGGIGYACRTSMQTAAAVGAAGEETLLYTRMTVREDEIALYGFSERSERSCFDQLTGISGVGPKAALAILSDLTPNRFALLVASGDSSALTKVKGIGKKSAERIVVDLKDKLAKSNPVMKELPASGGAVGTDGLSEALAALLVLGYRQEEVLPVLAKLPPDTEAEELIRLTLREMGKKR